MARAGFRRRRRWMGRRRRDCRGWIRGWGDGDSRCTRAQTVAFNLGIPEIESVRQYDHRVDEHGGERAVFPPRPAHGSGNIGSATLLW